MSQFNRHVENCPTCVNGLSGLCTEGAMLWCREHKAKNSSVQPTETQPTSTVSDAPTRIWIESLWFVFGNQWAAILKEPAPNSEEYIAKSEVDKLVEVMRYTLEFVRNNQAYQFGLDALAEYNERITK